MKLQHLKPPRPRCGNCYNFEIDICLQKLKPTYKKCSGCRDFRRLEKTDRETIILDPGGD
jgi:hypothetical protein